MKNLTMGSDASIWMKKSDRRMHPHRWKLWPSVASTGWKKSGCRMDPRRWILRSLTDRPTDRPSDVPFGWTIEISDRSHIAPLGWIFALGWMVKILLSAFNSCHGGLYVDSVFHSFFNQSTYLGSFDIKLILFSENVEISPPKKK
jgi:hypothetical protein